MQYNKVQSFCWQMSTEGFSVFTDLTVKSSLNGAPIMLVRFPAHHSACSSLNWPLRGGLGGFKVKVVGTVSVISLLIFGISALAYLHTRVLSVALHRCNEHA